MVKKNQMITPPVTHGFILYFTLPESLMVLLLHIVFINYKPALLRDQEN